MDLALQPKGCDLAAQLDEIGHIVGLLHERRSVDRNSYLGVSDMASHGELGTPLTPLSTRRMNTLQSCTK